MDHNLCIACKTPIPIQNRTCANCRERPMRDGRPTPNYALCGWLAAFSLSLGVAAAIYGGSSAPISRNIPPWVLGMSISVPIGFVLLISYLVYFMLTNPEAE